MQKQKLGIANTQKTGIQAEKSELTVSFEQYQ